MWQKTGRIILIFLCMTILAGFVLFDAHTTGENPTDQLSFFLGDEVIYAWEDGDARYLFLPSYADIQDVTLTSYSDEFEVADTGETVERNHRIPQLKYNEKYVCKSLSTLEEFEFCVMKSENLPAIFMETDSGTVDAIRADKTVEENGKLRLFSAEGEFLYRGGLNHVRARGNYSFANYEKKPFSITLKEEVSLLGLGAGQKYVLLSNASDPTLIRNDIARRLEEALGAEYNNVGRFVDLYANGNYLGNYYLCESIDIGYGRINVTDLEEQMDLVYRKSNYESFETYENEYARARNMDDLPLDITGGYLLERELEERYRLENEENPSGFITDSGEHFIVKSPMYCSVEQIEYLRNYMNEAEEAILSPEGICKANNRSYEEYIDVDSFVKKYLVEEITKNYDAGVSSMYFYKDSDSVDSRLKAAPIWDADMSLGSYLEWMEYYSENPEGITKLSLHPSASPWYEALYQKEEYYRKVQEYYSGYAVSYLEELAENGLREYEQRLSASAAMDEIRWRNDYEKNPYYEDREAEFEQLKDYICKRKAFLDKVWVEGEVYHIVTFEKDGNTRGISYIADGETVTELPVLLDEDFNGWQYNGEKITEDTVIICK